MTYDATQLDAELKAAGLPIAGCDSTGRVTWPGDMIPTPTQLATIQAVLAAHDPTKAANEKAANAAVVMAAITDLDSTSETVRRAAIRLLLRYLLTREIAQDAKKPK